MTSLEALTQAKPDEGLIWASLGDAQLAVADKSFATGKQTAPTTDAPTVGKYNDAIASYQKANGLNATAKKPSPELVYSSSWNEGVAYARTGRFKESSDAFDTGAKAQPEKAGPLYDVELATLFNLNHLDGSAPIADKAIAADPKHAINYYIKGQSLVAGATLDPRRKSTCFPRAAWRLTSSTSNWTRAASFRRK